MTSQMLLSYHRQRRRHNFSCIFSVFKIIQYNGFEHEKEIYSLFLLRSSEPGSNNQFHVLGNDSEHNIINLTYIPITDT